MALSKIELIELVKKFRGLGEDAMADKYQRELDKIENSSSGNNNHTTGDIILNITADDFEKSSSKFAAPGLHLAEFSMPYWKQVGRSLAFPYIITEEGDDMDKSGEIYCGVSKEAAWKVKEILKAVNVSYKTTNGMVSFNPAEVAGKKAKILYTQVRDTRSPEEGGKGTIYTKPAENNCVFEENATLESIGVTMQSLLLH